MSSVLLGRRTEDTNVKTGDARYRGQIAKSKQSRDGHLEVLADSSTDGSASAEPVSWGSEAQATHRREGEAGHNLSLVGTMGDTQRSQTISTINQGIAKQEVCDSGMGSRDQAGDRPPLLVGESSLARVRMLTESDPGLVFTSLAHRTDLYLLKKCFRQIRRSKSGRVDKITSKEYPKNLDENLYNLYQRLRRGQYVATPVGGIWIDK